MRIGSLFAGIGGLELGLEWAGVGHTVWQVERDPFCRKVLEKHWPDAQRFEDVRDVGAHNLPPVDVICGGYPCQPFSIAGHQKGEDDERHLWPEFARILGEVRPRFAVLENVAGHLALGFGRVLGDLADLGYDAEWRVLSAAEVGAPHTRPRLFVLAYTTSRGRPEMVSSPQTQSRQPSVRWPAGDAYSRLSPAQRVSELERLCGEPAILGDGDGVTAWVDRLKATGNAVVPQVAQIVGHRLLQIAASLDNLPTP